MTGPRNPRKNKTSISKKGTAPAGGETPTEFRLQKFLASAGLGSRRQCEELIRTGRVTVDGLPVENPGINVTPLKQVVEYDGERLKPERLKYFVLNKPKGVLCTNHDPAGRTRVIDLFAKERVRLFPVGRLDEDSEGLLIVTNDGDLANQLAHPRYRIYRTYRVQVAGFPTNEKLQQLRDGIFFREGKFQVISAKFAGKQGKSAFLEIVLGQGHNREIRRLFARIGHKVMSLQRIAFGPIRLGKQKVGQYRELTRNELEELRSILERNKKTPPKGPRSGGSGNSSPKRGSKGAPKGRRKPEGSGRKPEMAGSEEATPQKKRIRRPNNSPTVGASGGKSGGRPSGGKSRSSYGSSKPAAGKKKTKTYDFH